MLRALAIICFVKATRYSSSGPSDPYPYGAFHRERRENLHLGTPAMLLDGVSAQTNPGASMNLRDPVIGSYTMHGLDLRSDAQIIKLSNEPILYEPLDHIYDDEKMRNFKDGQIMFAVHNKRLSSYRYRVDLFCFDSEGLKYGNYVEFIDKDVAWMNGVFPINVLVESEALWKQWIVERAVGYCGQMKLRREYLNDLLKIPNMLTDGPFVTERILVENMSKTFYINPVFRGFASDIPTRIITV